MKKEDLKGKKVGVLGLGVEGYVSAAYLHKLGAQVTVLDEKEEKELDVETVTSLRELGIAFQTGKQYKDNLAHFDLLVRSPGVKLTSVERNELQKSQTQITSQTQLFLKWTQARVIGVTGTKGKGTTSSLIYEMLKASGMDTYLGGNIGTPPFTFLDNTKETSVVVLELSSYQLEDLGNSPEAAKALAGKPHIAVMLMIVPDHLHYHGDMAEYVDAKRNILRFQTSEDFAVINRDYVPSNESDIYTEGKVFQVTRERTTTEQGTFLKEHAIWMRMQAPINRRSAPEGVEDAEWKVIDTKDIALPGKHNLENAAAAAMAATLAGAAKSDIVEVLRTFKGLTHRLELVGEVNGVSYYDDSIATNPESTIAAIEAFTQPKVLILGGVTEGSDFSMLGEVIAQDKNIRAIIGIGKEWGTIKAAIQHYSSSGANGEVEKSDDDSSPRADSSLGRKIMPILLEGAQDMKTVVQAAAKVAQPGDVVLLSPACKSFDMFKSYEDRGDQFKEEVKKLS